MDIITKIVEFDSIVDTAKTIAKVDFSIFAVCTLTAIVLGALIAISFSIKNTDTTRNFVITTAVMPAAIEIIILVVNSLTAGIAIAGLFNLVRFRSVSGNSREITSILMSTVIGVTLGMGYIAYGVIIALLVIILNIIMAFTGLGTPRSVGELKTLKITVPESLDFEGIFDDIFAEYTTYNTVEKIQTTNMGSMYRISYKIKLKAGVSEKKMIDDIRVRNGNLDVICGRFDSDKTKKL